jgi:ELWxxDGT repeat protein
MGVNLGSFMRLAPAVSLILAVSGCQGSGPGGRSDVPAAVILKDIAPGTEDGFWGELTVFKGKAYFKGKDPAHGTELWVTDGTEAGTQLVLDIDPGPVRSPGPPRGSGEPSELTSIGDQLLFAASDRRGRELWATDGTASGTRLVADIDPAPFVSFGVGESYPVGFLSMGNIALFRARTPSTGNQTWRSDGTAEGTLRLTDTIDPDGPDLGVRFGKQVAFISADAVNGREVWLTDGSPAGTHLLIDAYPGRLDLSAQRYVGGPKLLVSIGERLIFRQDNGLWSSDGTERGSEIVSKVLPSYSAAVGRRALMYVYTEDGAEIWQSDGTVGGTRPLLAGPTIISDIRTPAPNRERYPYWESFGPAIAFSALDPRGAASPTQYTPYRAWITDGTAAGTRMLRDVVPGEPEWAWVDESNGCIWLTIPGGAGIWQIWRTDGTSAGSRQVGTFNGKEIRKVTALGGVLLVQGETDSQGTELWALPLR